MVWLAAQRPCFRPSSSARHRHAGGRRLISSNLSPFRDKRHPRPSLSSSRRHRHAWPASESSDHRLWTPGRRGKQARGATPPPYVQGTSHWNTLLLQLDHFRDSHTPGAMANAPPDSAPPPYTPPRWLPTTPPQSGPSAAPWHKHAPTTKALGKLRAKGRAAARGLGEAQDERTATKGKGARARALQKSEGQSRETRSTDTRRLRGKGQQHR